MKKDDDAAPRSGARKRRPRTRLTGEAARARILEAAVERLRAEGPQALTLSVLAKELVISHQAILHHFGSRDGLIAAVLTRALENLEAELAGGLRVLDQPHKGSGVIITRAFEVIADQGHGRLLAWLALGDTAALPQQERKPLELLAQITHGLRTRDHPDASYRDTVFTVMLSAYMVLAASVFEEGTLHAAGLSDDPSAKQEFREWFANLVVDHLDRRTQPAPT